jgi:hypothetical protein
MNAYHYSPFKPTILLMPIDSRKATALRRVITEGLRIQRDGAATVPYVDVTNALEDIGARANHVVFARRGCGKSLLLHQSRARPVAGTACVYLNCEDFKKHTFPNVLIEVLDQVFATLDKHLRGWFGRKRRAGAIIKEIRSTLSSLRARADEREERVRASSSLTDTSNIEASLQLADLVQVKGSDAVGRTAQIERQYETHDSKIDDLNRALPGIKAKLRELFEESSTIKCLHIQLDDFYHLLRVDQPHVADYIHRLCKDVPMFFKIATLRHASTLFADRNGQPTGAQERHDYQPLNIDFTVADLKKTERQLKKIFYEYGKLARLSEDEIDGLFKGDGFRRLVLTGGGVPRDCLSLFLEALTSVDGSIGKDDIRTLSRQNLERRIEELKQDSLVDEQGILIRGIYAIRQFSIVDKKSTVFVVADEVLQTNDRIRALIYRLLDYRLIHSVGAAFTHKSSPGTFQGFVVDVGCYANLRKLHGKLNELDLARADWREKVRSAPILDAKTLDDLWKQAPADAERAMAAEGDDVEP